MVECSGDPPDTRVRRGYATVRGGKYRVAPGVSTAARPAAPPGRRAARTWPGPARSLCYTTRQPGEECCRPPAGSQGVPRLRAEVRERSQRDARGLPAHPGNGSGVGSEWSLAGSGDLEWSTGSRGAEVSFGEQVVILPLAPGSPRADRTLRAIPTLSFPALQGGSQPHPVSLGPGCRQRSSQEEPPQGFPDHRARGLAGQGTARPRPPRVHPAAVMAWTPRPAWST